MPKVSRESATQGGDYGAVLDRAEEVEGYTISFVSFRQDIDATPLYKGLPDDRCQCPHWGYVTKGAVTFRYADRDEVIEAGEAFYTPPGHVPVKHEREGFGLVERDEHRHVAFGVRFLRDAIREDARHRATVERVVLELAPKAAYVFAPPYVTDASDYVSYGYTSRQIYGLAYRTLRRRMKVLGIEVPPADEFMPGPIDGTAEFAAVPADTATALASGAASNGSGDLEAAATS